MSISFPQFNALPILCATSSSWLIQDLPERKPCCWEWSRGLTISRVRAWTTCSRTLDTRDSKDIGRHMTRVSLVWGTGIIFAYFHFVGTLPKVNNLLNSSVRDGRITSAHSFNNLTDIPSQISL